MTRCKGSNEYVCFGVWLVVGVGLLVNDFQNVVIAYAQGLHMVGTIGEDVEQFMGLFELQDLGLVGPFPKFSPKTVQHELGNLLPPRIFLNILQLDSFFLFVQPFVLPFLCICLAPAGPASGLLFDLEPSVDVVGEESLLGVCKMPHFVDSHEDVPPGSGFLEFGGTPRTLKLALLIGMVAGGATFKQGFRLFLLDTGHAQGEGEFTPVTHGEDWMV